MQKKPENMVSPSEFMRQIRPELYSDSAQRIKHQLKAEVLSHHLDTITDRNQTHDFELFCRKLCERTICPNLRPATGPEGGGDSKADTETSPVSDEISKLAYVGLANSGSERWAFAFSAKKVWADKARSDVAGIMATNRGYKKVFFVTSRPARAKDRARIEEELSSKYGVQVTIHDRTWIIKEVIENSRRDLAYYYLGIGDEASDLDLGPSDYSRKRQLAEIEQELTDPEAFTGMKMQRAAEALVAAKLARELELPRPDVDGRLLRAVRLADDGGTRRQQLTARYETLWTAFWWFDDINAIVNGYDNFEALVATSEHAAELEMLCNLLQLLFNAVIHGHLTPEQVGLKQRVARLLSRLTELASDSERPNNALEAKVSLLTISVNEAVMAREPGQLAILWPQFRKIVAKADGLGEFDASRLVRLIEVFGKVAGKDRSYRDLVDQVSDFVARRTGESLGALVLLKRANQLDFDENMEMIRVLGKAVRMLSKKEHAEDLVDALCLLGVAYRSAGLLWAARASCTSAAAILFIEADEDGSLPATAFPTLMNAAWMAVELKHFPEILEIIQIARGSLSALPYDDESSKRADKQLQDFDLVLACQLANLSRDEVQQLETIPDILSGLGMNHSKFTLLYMLGYEKFLRGEGWIPESESASDVASFFNRLAGQPAGDASWRPAIFNGQNEQVFATSVLGVQVRVAHKPTDICVTVSEAIVATVEAFFATAFELEVAAHSEQFDVAVVEEDIARFAVVIDIDQMRATVRWPRGLFPGSPSVHADFLNMLLEVAATIFSATCRTKENLEEAIARLFKTDAAIDRVAMIGSVCSSRQRIFRGVSRLSSWDRYEPKRFEAKLDRPKVKREPPLAKAHSQETGEFVDERPEVLKMTDHRDVKVRSVIDIHLWDRAGWTGTAYGMFAPEAPPFMALMFKNREAAKKIFERWRERFGDADKEEEIYIGVVRQFSVEHPTHYGVIVTSSIQKGQVDSRFTMLASRSLTMEPSDDVNLTRFLDHYRRVGAYLLMPAVLMPGQSPILLKDVYLLKRSLHAKIAADVGPYDLENMFLKVAGLEPGQA
ncbi:tetratricopeptide repeat protein [Tahibacter caeni]|uniref:tetratricopeptide repeat protein n=1 Tax=Tahibacter caeni TaxID=1453545 RepID=UPI002148E842|nr:tetratricopeptide repeat protein [Tahibacter caeni]